MSPADDGYAQGSRRSALPFPGIASSPAPGNNGSANVGQSHDSSNSMLASFISQARLQQDHARARNVSGSSHRVVPSDSPQNSAGQHAAAVFPSSSKYQTGDRDASYLKTLSSGPPQSPNAQPSERQMERTNSMSSNLSMSSSANRRRNVPPPPLDLMNCNPSAGSSTSPQGSFPSSQSLQEIHAHAPKRVEPQLQPAYDISRTRTTSGTSKGKSRLDPLENVSQSWRNGTSLPKSGSTNSHLSSGTFLSNESTGMESALLFRSGYELPNDLKAPSPSFMKRSESSGSSSHGEQETSSRSRGTERRDTLTSSHSSPRSPPANVDRTRLIGLAELSTPRWKAAGHTSWSTPFLPTWEHTSQPPVPRTPAQYTEDSPISPTDDMTRKQTGSASASSPQTFSPASVSTTLTKSPGSPSNAINAIDSLLNTLESDEEAFKIWEASQETAERQAEPRAAPAKIGLGFEMLRSRPHSEKRYDDSGVGGKDDAIGSPSAASSHSITPHAASRTQRMSSSASKPPRAPSSSEKERPRRSTSAATPKTEDDANASQRCRKVSGTSNGAESPQVLSEKSPRSSTHSRRQSAGGVSIRSHHSSKSYGAPSQVAQSILRAASQTHEGADIDAIAANDGGTAAALRKLDGISASPRAGRHSRPPSPRSLTNSITPRKDALPSNEASGRASKRLRTRNSGANDESINESFGLHSHDNSPGLPSPASFGSNAQSQPRKASLVTSALLRPTSSETNGASSSSQRDSTSSASNSAAFSSAVSRDSTSFTSISTSSPVYPNSQRHSLKSRRTSTSSDVSNFSEGSRRGSADATLMQHDASLIPPVPPLPKDWERRASQAMSASPTTQTKQGTPRNTSSRATGTPTASAFAAPLLSPSLSSPSGLGAQPSSPVSPALATAKPSAVTKKWSISSALGMGKPSPNESMSTSSSHSDILAAGSNGSVPLQNSYLMPSPSTTSIAEFRDPVMAAGIPSSPSLQSVASLKNDDHSLASNTSVDQKRSEHPAPRIPSSASRQHSGIPFFSRKASGQSKASLESSSSDASPKVASSPIAEARDKDKDKKEGGRKSILGLTFLGRKGDRSSVSDSSPTIPPSASFSSRLTKPLLLSPQKRTVTADAPTPVRKRGKTLPTGDAPKPEPTYLPPMHISAIPQATAKRIEDRTILRSVSDQSKGALPTIAGSPSVHAQVPSEQINDTPTRIPRKVKESSSPMPDHSQQSQTSEFGEWKSKTAQLTLPHVHSQLSSSLPDKPLVANVKTGGSNSASLFRARRTSSSTSISSIPRSASNSTLNADRSSKTIVPPSTAASMQRHVKRLSVAASHRDSDKPGTPLTNRLSTSRSTKDTGYDGKEEGSVSARGMSSPASAASRHIRRISNNIKSVASTNTDSLLAASTSRSSRVMSDKLSIPSRISKSTTMPSLHRASVASDVSPSSSSSRNGTPGEEEDSSRADQEMAQYVKRVTTKKLSAGHSASEIKKMFEFPARALPTSKIDVADVLHLYNRELSDYEKEEILEYKHVYYLGQGSSKVLARSSNPVNNFGYDDDRGDYQVIMHDHILFRYEITGTLGKGSFGQVLQCRDHKTGEMVAVKIIRNKKRFHHQALVEIKVLENLRKWDPDAKHNVIQMTDSFSFRSHLCIVTELLSINLYELIKANNFAGFSTTLIRRFTVQMLNALTLLRHHRVVHCDLKPENVLLKHPCKSGVQVIDFGSSCFENEKVYTYIQSRFYRSVEVILGSNYHMAIDMWSLGCIMAEMYTGMPLFPGENEQEQLACIIEVLGVPDRHLVDRSSRRKLFFDSTGAPRPVVNSKGRRRRPGAKTLASVLKCDDELFVDFIAKCLIFDPDRRMKPQAALRHPFVRPELATATRTARSSTASGIQSSVSSTNISTPRKRTAALSSSNSAALLTTPANSAYSLHSSTASVGRVRHPTTSSLPSSANRVVGLK